MKRQKENKQQVVFNQCTLTKIDEDCYKVTNMKGKLLQKLVSESKFKTIKTIVFKPQCINKDIAAALVQMGRAEGQDELKLFYNSKVIVYKHLIENGYKVRPISNELIAICGINNKEQILKVVNSKQTIVESVFTPNEVNKENDISFIGVVQQNNVVFVSVEQQS
ncbi:hypothetical protein KM1_057600 [Entamoeba histolytica HM-3:IMSS]|uniref:Uncharacterized protein n=3 Tax=Entamoeba histolytica TaxID=5759 RepID=C4M8F3_ENTH1|nr:hypothetical protein EHI_036500 [Entamoeba histolytica HM-1:IMSS]EAL46186.1 hypothetical protein EHI_036500 [Entamoeba histolytica HM-1:IMSS]EMS16275.1 hypothetical protein KM1_057600 [Entamoeba histolytica HM-3:IMSS]ENY60864.1 hypothetical protein EHI7A_028850 [Entamoeba histolytica HM-1:IMSS-A]|eukprot:XP_651573.1 hypothetical protein EHI_036500 [Entamoeba histolytica HM-1:IMSS]